MKLSKILAEVFSLVEKTGEELIASKVAKKMGLVYKGFGRWADPETNKIVAKTINGKLVKVQPVDQEKDRSSDSSYSMRTMAKKVGGSDSNLPKSNYDKKREVYDKIADKAANLEDPVYNTENGYDKMQNAMHKILSQRDDIEIDPKLIGKDVPPDELASIHKFLNNTVKNGRIEIYHDVNGNNNNGPNMREPQLYTFDKFDANLLRSVTINPDGDYEFNPRFYD